MKGTGEKVLVVASFAPSLIGFRGDMIAEFVARGHAVHTCAPGAERSVAAGIESLGARFHPIPLARTSIDPLSDIRYLFALRRLIRDLSIDTVLCYTMKPVVFGSLATRSVRGARSCSLVTGLGYGFVARGARARLVGSALSPLLRLALRSNDVVMFQNPDDRQLFLDRGLLSPRQRSCVIDGSGVDIERFAPAPLPDGMRFLCIARLLVEKGLNEYLEAARRVRSEHPDVRFALAGGVDGNADPNLARALDDAIAGGDVDYLGELDDVRDALAATTVYVQPSYREGTPRAVLEALATGRPVLTTDAPGCRETVTAGINGLLCEPRDAESLVGALERFVAMPREALDAMGEASRALAERRYDVRRVNAQIIEACAL